MGDDAEDRWTYCLQPEKFTPLSGTYTITRFVDDDGTGRYAQLRKFLYFCPGFYGYTTHGKAIFAKYAANSAYTTPHYALAHVVLAWKNGTSDESFRWTDWGNSNVAPAVWNDIMALDDSLIPDSFTAFLISTDGYEDVIGGFYRPTGYIDHFGGINKMVHFC